MNLSVETQQEVIFLEDLCKIFWSFTVSTCLKMHFRHPKISKFSGPPSYPRGCAPSRATFGSQISTPKTKILPTALIHGTRDRRQGLLWSGTTSCVSSHCLPDVTVRDQFSSLPNLPSLYLHTTSDQNEMWEQGNHSLYVCLKYKWHTWDICWPGGGAPSGLFLISYHILHPPYLLFSY